MQSQEVTSEEVRAALGKLHQESHAALGKVTEDNEKFIKAQKERMGEFNNKQMELQARLQEVEQNIARKPRKDSELAGESVFSEIANSIVSSDNTKAFLANGSPTTRIDLPASMLHSGMRAAITNDTGSNQPLVAPDRRPGMVSLPERRMTIRDLFTNMPTESNLIEHTRELVFTNSAAVVASGSPPVHENVLKPESNITFQLVTTAVPTIAHWLHASRQVLFDALLLERYIRDRMMYGLAIAEEREFLTGVGGSSHVSGLITNATAYSGGYSGTPTPIDIVGRSFSQLAALEMAPTGIILNPTDWWSSSFRLLKDSQGRYILGDPQLETRPRLFGVDVVLTNSMTAGKFLTLDAPRAGYVADRETASVRISEHDSDNFRRNMVTILAELRSTIVIERTQALIYGDLDGA